MSKIGKLPITIPSTVTVKINQDSLDISSSSQSFQLSIPPQIKIDLQENTLVITRLSEAKAVKAKHGAIRSNISNYIIGLVTPWKKSLELIGTGYKASVSGGKINLTVGFIKPVSLDIPDGLNVTCDQDTIINISGADRVKVGQLASNIRKIRPPEPYKGKGIRYQGEFIKLKAGKTAKGTA